jgi:hypothetical protein
MEKDPAIKLGVRVGYALGAVLVGDIVFTVVLRASGLYGDFGVG